jgi:hypothetical protein
MALEKEWEVYQRELPNLLSEEGRFALVSANGVESIWDTEEDAEQAGYDRFGLEPFLVHQIRAVERPVFLRYPLPGSCRT